ncbi:MAG: hypothetical protein ABEH78_04345 [Haloferacaceae archaeon]
MSTATGSETSGGTTGTVRATGHVRDELGTPGFEFTLAGDRLRDLLDARLAHGDRVALIYPFIFCC